jgi:hypothetical protein
LMMLARFALQDCSQTSSQHAVSAVTPQRAIINIASAGSVTQVNQQQGYKISCGTPLDDAGKLCCKSDHRPAVSLISLHCVRLSSRS